MEKSGESLEENTKYELNSVTHQMYSKKLCMFDRNFFSEGSKKGSAKPKYALCLGSLCLGIDPAGEAGSGSLLGAGSGME